MTGGLYAAARLGAFAFLAACWVGGAASRRARKILWSAWAVALVSTAMGIVLQGPYAAGLPLADGLTPGLIGDVLETRFGTGGGCPPVGSWASPCC